MIGIGVDLAGKTDLSNRSRVVSVEQVMRNEINIVHVGKVPYATLSIVSVVLLTNKFYCFS